MCAHTVITEYSSSTHSNVKNFSSVTVPLMPYSVKGLIPIPPPTTGAVRRSEARPATESRYSPKKKPLPTVPPSAPPSVLVVVCNVCVVCGVWCGEW